MPDLRESDTDHQDCVECEVHGKCDWLNGYEQGRVAERYRIVETLRAHAKSSVDCHWVWHTVADFIEAATSEGER